MDTAIIIATPPDKDGFYRRLQRMPFCEIYIYTLESIVKEELFRYTDLVKDVKMAEGVSDELYDIAKRILRKKEGDKNCETESSVLCK